MSRVERILSIAIKDKFATPDCQKEIKTLNTTAVLSFKDFGD